MEDLQLWNQALRSIDRMLAELSPGSRQCLSELLTGYRHEKEALAAMTSQIDSETICRACAGKCCQNGKYRINVFDLIAHCTAGMKVLPDFEQKPLCPYGTVQGCLVEPGYRPADCIIFVCDALDSRLSDSDRSTQNMSEKKLRDCLHRASILLGIPVATPLLLWAENIVFQPIHCL